MESIKLLKFKCKLNACNQKKVSLQNHEYQNTTQKCDFYWLNIFMYTVCDFNFGLTNWWLVQHDLIIYSQYYMNTQK